MSVKREEGSELTAVSSDTPSDTTSTEYFFGLGGCHLKFLQIFANKKFFTFLACCLAFLQTGISQGYIPVILSSIEKRYNFGSTEAGALIGVFDGTIAISVVVVSYFGSKVHKPRLLGAFAILIAIGAFIFISPQFIFGSYSFNTEGNTNSTSILCNNTNLEITNDDCLSVSIGPYIILLIGIVLLAIGSSPVYTIVPSYIDEIVFPRYVSLHLAVFFVSSVIGPAVGFLTGSVFLSLYVDPWLVTDLTPEDPTWVGAWWIGPVIFGFLQLLLSILFFMFPKYLSDSHLVKKERLKEMAKTFSSKYDNENNISSIFKTFPLHLKQLFLNPSFMLMCIGLTFAVIVKDGLFAFGPKYIEIMFSLTATTSGLMAGGIAVAGAGIGTATGGLIMYFFKLKGRQSAFVIWVVMTITIIATFLFFLRCPSPEIAGISAPYADGSFNGKDSSVCSMSCNCMSLPYDPICGVDALSYYSPCHAGCMTETRNQAGETMFQNCTCIMESITNSNGTIGSSSTAISGTCSSNCDAYLWTFIIALAVLVVLLLMIEIPFYYATMRVVADEQRPFALGFQSFVYRIFGSIPGPLLFGAVFDGSCVVFNYQCGKRGNCWIYDHRDLSLYAFLLSLPCMIIATLLLFLHWVTFPKVKEPDTSKSTIT